MDKEAEYWNFIKDDFGFMNMNFLVFSKKQLYTEEDRLSQTWSIAKMRNKSKRSTIISRNSSYDVNSGGSTGTGKMATVLQKLRVTRQFQHLGCSNKNFDVSKRRSSAVSGSSVCE